MTPGMPTRVALATTLLLVAVAGVWFGRRQNRADHLGGRLSVPKQLWLIFAVYLWFFACPVLRLEARGALRDALTLVAASMWLRGPIELLMMYVTKNWRALYGIAHTATTLAGCTGALVVKDIPPLVGYQAWLMGLVLLVTASLAAEVYYAVVFRRIVGERTTGGHAVWFASADEPAFARINRLTAGLNIFFYGSLAAFLLRALVF